MAKVRFQMFIDKTQKEALDSLQQDSRMPVAEMVRKAIDKFLAEWKVKKRVPPGDEMTERLISVAGTCKGGPKDLADKHDKYLYRTSRK